MGLRNASPGEGGRNLHVHFRYVSVAPGKSWFAHVAGPAQWFITHTSERTKPCLSWITSGALHCPLCGRAKEPQMLGYLPLYRSTDGCPVLVVVYEDQREFVDEFNLHDRVQVGRESEKGDAVYARKALSQEPKYKSTLAVRMLPADITDTLLMMWKIPELKEWAKQQPKVSDTAVSLPPGVVLDSAGKPFGPMYQNAAKRAGFTPVREETLDKAYDATTNKLRKKAAGLPPSTNGNGHHDSN